MMSSFSMPEMQAHPGRLHPGAAEAFDFDIRTRLLERGSETRPMLVARGLAGENQDAGHANDDRRPRLRNNQHLYLRASALSNTAGDGEARGAEA